MQCFFIKVIVSDNDIDQLGGEMPRGADGVYFAGVQEDDQFVCVFPKRG